MGEDNPGHAFDLEEILMGWVRKDLENPNLSPEDREAGTQVLKNFMANDEWATKIFKKVGILLTSHPGNRAYLKGSVESHKKLGCWIALVYDNFLDPTRSDITYDWVLPARDVMDQVDTFIMPHHQTWGGVLYPYFWHLKWGITILQDFEYIYCANGDFIVEKPEGFPKLLEMMGDADIMSCGPVTDRSVNTAGFIGKASALKKLVQHYQDHFVPFEAYEKYTQEFGNAEGRFFRAIKDLGLKQIIVDPPTDEQCGLPLKGTWYDVIGFRHIHAEHNKAYKYKGIPPDPKYFDPRFMGSEYETIKKYYETKDMSLLENWWAK